MNEPGMLVTPPADPPSYLRPPVASPSSGPNSSLLVIGGVLALVVIVGAWYVLRPSASPIFGFLALIDSGTEPGIYNYSFSSQNKVPIFTSSEAFALPHEILYASYSSNFSYEIESRINIESDTPLVVVNRIDKTQTIVSTGPAGTVFRFPIISNRGTRVAYLSLAPSHATLILATRSKDQFSLTNLPMAGTPLAFSPDESAILVAKEDGLALINIHTNAITTISGTPKMGSLPPAQVAISENGAMLALALAGGVYGGSIDWTNGVFAETFVIQEQANAVFFGKDLSLLVLADGEAHRYDMLESSPRLTGSSSYVPSDSESPFAWLTLKEI